MQQFEASNPDPETATSKSFSDCRSTLAWLDKKYDKIAIVQIEAYGTHFPEEREVATLYYDMN